MVDFKNSKFLAEVMQQTRHQEAVLPGRADYDPTYPRFSFEEGHMYLAYVPHVATPENTGTYRIVEVEKDGKTYKREVFNADTPLVHGVNTPYKTKDGIQRFMMRNVRCINGLNIPELGYSPEKGCPLCEAAVDSQNLTREQVDFAHPGENLQGKDWAAAAQKFDSTRQVTGINSKDQNKSRRHVFAAGIIEVKLDGMDYQIVSEEPTMVFMDLSNNQWTKWKDACAGNAESPAGHWFRLSYPESNGSKMESGRNMTVQILTSTAGSEFGDKLAKLAAAFDDEFLHGKDPKNPHPWTLDVIYDKVGSSRFLPYDELEKMHDNILQQNELTRLSLTGGTHKPSEAGIIASAGIAGGGITGKAGNAVPPQLDASDVLGQVDAIPSTQAAKETAKVEAKAAADDVDDLTLD